MSTEECLGEAREWELHATLLQLVCGFPQKPMKGPVSPVGFPLDLGCARAPTCLGKLWR